MLGIGVITRNRIASLQKCIAQIQAMTPRPYALCIADDGSTDGSAAWATAAGHTVITGDRMGCAWNKNRALNWLTTMTDADTIVLLEDDTYPIAPDWSAFWTQAARQWQHVNFCYGFQEGDIPPGVGSISRPWQCAAFGGCCTVTTRAALAQVGFLDTRFVGYGWEHVEWTHRFRLFYEDYWLQKGIAIDRVPCVTRGIELTWPGTLRNQTEMDANGATYHKILASASEILYRPVARTTSEQTQISTELAAVANEEAY